MESVVSIDQNAECPSIQPRVDVCGCHGFEGVVCLHWWNIALQDDDDDDDDDDGDGDGDGDDDDDDDDDAS